jgi:putative nucleotidyltransferase with HDIG domain
VVSVDAARELAGTALRGVPERWRHTTAVVARAAALADTVPASDRDLLLAAAWLHDIGYGRALRHSGLHPLDGARHLREAGWDERLCGLVAHHSGARFIATARGIRGLLEEFACEDSAVADALTYADQVVGFHGRPVNLRERINGASDRQCSSSANARARHTRAPHLLAIADRVERRLAPAM